MGSQLPSLPYKIQFGSQETLRFIRVCNTKLYLFISKSRVKIPSFCTHLVVLNISLVLLSPSRIMPRLLASPLFLLLRSWSCYYLQWHCFPPKTKFGSYILPQNPIQLFIKRISDTSSAKDLILVLGFFCQLVVTVGNSERGHVPQGLPKLLPPLGKDIQFALMVPDGYQRLALLSFIALMIVLRAGKQ